MVAVRAVLLLLRWLLREELLLSALILPLLSELDTRLLRVLREAVVPEALLSLERFTLLLEVEEVERLLSLLTAELRVELPLLLLVLTEERLLISLVVAELRGALEVRLLSELLTPVLRVLLEVLLLSLVVTFDPRLSLSLVVTLEPRLPLSLVVTLEERLLSLLRVGAVVVVARPEARSVVVMVLLPRMEVMVLPLRPEGLFCTVIWERQAVMLPKRGCWV